MSKLKPITITLLDEPKDRIGIESVILTEQMNILAGPNGSGKSTIIDAIRKGKARSDTKMPLICFDTEKDNPRTKAYLMDGVEAFQIGSMFCSHGESIRPVLEQGLGEKFKEHKDRVLVMLDEPEAGLDHDAVTAVLKFLKEQPSRIRYLIATHSPIWWLAADSIIELSPGYVERVLREQWKTMTTGDGLAPQQQPVRCQAKKQESPKRRAEKGKR